MRSLSRMGLGLVGLALVAPAGAWADPPTSSSAAPPRQGLLHKTHLCPKCQRAELQAQGIAVPPAPPLPRVGVVPTKDRCDRCGAVVMMVSAPDPNTVYSTPAPASASDPAAAAPMPSQGQAQAWTSVPLTPAPPAPAPSMASTPPLVPGPTQTPAWASNPATAAPIVVAETVAPAANVDPGASRPLERLASAVSRSKKRSRTENPGTMVAGAAVPGQPCVACAANEAPGYAVVGGSGAPGYAMVGGAISAEPAPIGMIQGRYAYEPQGTARPSARAAAGPGGRGTTDSAVMPSSFSTDPYDPIGHNRPHILTHLFGLDAIGHRAREEKQRRDRERHAMISYQPQSSPVVDVPASVVYGRR